MQTKARNKTIILSTIAGAALGYFILHPYSMLVYSLHSRHEMAEQGGSLSLADAVQSFRPDMLHMGIPYAVFGAAAGLFFGFWLEGIREKEEAAIHKVAVVTLRELMVTLAHYLLNASTVIGGYAAHIKKRETDEEIKRHLDIIIKEAECVEGVVKSLQSIETIVTEPYVKDSDTLIIDIRRDLERKIQEKEDNRREQAREGELPQKGQTR